MVQISKTPHFAAVWRCFPRRGGPGDKRKQGGWGCWGAPLGDASAGDGARPRGPSWSNPAPPREGHKPRSANPSAGGWRRSPARAVKGVVGASPEASSWPGHSSSRPPLNPSRNVTEAPGFSFRGREGRAVQSGPQRCSAQGREGTRNDPSRGGTMLPWAAARAIQKPLPNWHRQTPAITSRSRTRPAYTKTICFLYGLRA